ncbi:energy-coupling factor transporter transmembrane protein EcfT [Bullifex porci]|uniref:energy-coupling factor transporter transmembrane component T family protein n=1 Tax=Bullifex porci TaxID=2606638 RepID=UPI0023EFAC41|nr:energy-coupling factor transporter transmembrane component T [Bullifex porci]MDD7254705.1 energy-coupling factor transporter transmembrane component T [Bullifex porci]MDY2742077.1 energy-coupling factor transporter transmembrane component T [Bullifex porci]
MSGIFNYINRESVIHRMSGATKLIVLILWSLAAMTSFDTRFLALLPILAFILFGLSKIRFSDVKFLLWFTFVFMVLNNLLIYIFSPEHGVTIYGSRTVILEGYGRWTLTAEQLFYHLNVVLKYLATIPVVILFVSTTDPSEFASSLSKIGINYKVAYSVSLALRYIPDIQREFHDIMISQQARGLEMASKKQNIIKRLKNASAMLFPLIISSMDRIEVIANAMELRGFGKLKKRSWYSERPFRAPDYTAIIFVCLLMVISLTLNFINGGRYFNPFIG